MSLNNHAYNLATGNKWLLTIPFNIIDPELKNIDIPFNLYGFTMPELGLSDVNFSLMGAEFPIPGLTRNESKILNVQYMPSTRYKQLEFLYKWFSLISNECGAASTNNPSEYRIDVTLTLLTEYKNPVFSIIYHSAFISRIDRLNLNYQDQGQNIPHNFDLKYAYYTIVDLPKE